MERREAESGERQARLDVRVDVLAEEVKGLRERVHSIGNQVSALVLSWPELQKTPSRLDRLEVLVDKLAKLPDEIATWRLEFTSFRAKAMLLALLAAPVFTAVMTAVIIRFTMGGAK